MGPGRAERRPDWVVRLHEILDERGEAPRKLIEEQMMLLIPSGPAHREGVAKAKTDYRYRMKKEGVEPDLDYQPGGDLTRKGRQRLALKTIHTEIAAGRVEKFEKDDRVWLRRRNGSTSELVRSYSDMEVVTPRSRRPA